jgi:hypothetical protein
MDVVVDGHLILSQDKSSNRANAIEQSKRQNIVAQGEFDESELAFLASAVAAITA